MGRRVTSAIIALAASLAMAASASAAQTTFYVTGNGDSPLSSCRATTVASMAQCDTLRAAVAAANANVSEADAIYLAPSGNISLGSALDVTDSLYIYGRG